MRKIVLVFFIVMCISCSQNKQVGVAKVENDSWETTLDKRLPEYGHRNWIVIADSAYPKQSSAGIETVYTNSTQVEVLQYVLSKIDEANHIQPVIMFDKELQSVSEKSAPGVKAYQSELNKLLGNRPFKEMPHEDIIRKLDQGSKLFNVLLLKTDMVIPYTSVFIELDCGYWNAEKEQELRELLNTKN